MEAICCAICGEDNTTPVFTAWGYEIVRCVRCNLAYVNPRSFSEEHDDYFKGPYLSTIEENGSLKHGIDLLYSDVLRNLDTYLSPGRLLDVGCAMGHFMVFARQRGWTVDGVECSRYAAECGRKRWDLQIQAVCDLRDARLSDNHFDACVLIEVAEHLPYPRITFTEALRVLKPGGMLYITTPNFASFRSLLQREKWAAVIPSGHLYYFTADSLGKLLTSIGFVQITNLTGSADLQTELNAMRVTGGLPIAPADLDKIERDTSIADAQKVANGRAEGLVMCAIKPRRDRDSIVASLRFPRPKPMYEGRLVRRPGDTPEDQKVYLIQEGRKHWVTSVQWLHSHGMRLEDTIQVSRELLDSILNGPVL